MTTRTYWFFTSQSVGALAAAIGFAATHHDGAAICFGLCWGALVLAYSFMETV